MHGGTIGKRALTCRDNGALGVRLGEGDQKERMGGQTMKVILLDRIRPRGDSLMVGVKAAR